MKPTQKAFGLLPLVAARVFEQTRPAGKQELEPPAYALQYVATMRAEKHLVVRTFTRYVRAGGASVPLLVVVVRRKEEITL